jgi:hypothetical protein
VNTPLYAQVDEEADLGEVDDEVEAIAEEEAVFSENNNTSNNGIHGRDTDEGLALSGSQYQVLEAKIDPLEWKKELERVGPKLKVTLLLLIVLLLIVRLLM